MNREAMDYVREDCARDARIDAYYEIRDIRNQQALQRQRMRNGGFTDEELMSEDEEFDEENEYGIV